MVLEMLTAATASDGAPEGLVSVVQLGRTAHEGKPASYGNERARTVPPSGRRRARPPPNSGPRPVSAASTGGTSPRPATKNTGAVRGTAFVSLSCDPRKHQPIGSAHQPTTAAPPLA